MKPGRTVYPVDEVIDLLSRGAGCDYIGEPVNQLAHGLQAAELARRAGASEALVLAALLHDIGHSCEPGATQMEGLGALHHEQVGSDYLEGHGFSSRIADLVSLHVDAKRYLARTKPGYPGKLSPASTRTLAFQGGPMSPAECRAFEAHPCFDEALQLRAFDEAAKDASARTHELEDYRAMLNRHALCGLTDEQVAAFRETGFVHLRGWYSEQEMTAIAEATDRLQALPEVPGRWMQYFEYGQNASRLLCRIENFLDDDVLFDEISRGSASINLVSRLMEEEATLFKEKINFKLPGGQGFAPHQDAPAFTSFNQGYHITMMLSLDASTVENGCLEIAGYPGRGELLPLRDDLTIADTAVSELHWQPVETSLGDLLLFDSYLPHRSGANVSGKPRRALYATYSRKAEGEFRQVYFEAKRREFPPEVERKPGRQYSTGVFNVGNPVTVPE